METDGTGKRRLAGSCDLPVANRAADSFACVSDDSRSMFIYSLNGGPGRLVYELPAGDRFCRFARWSDRGDTIRAVTERGRLLELDTSRPAVVSEERLPFPGADPNSTIFTAALTERGALEAFSVARFASSLYLLAGLE